MALLIRNDDRLNKEVLLDKKTDVKPINDKEKLIYQKDPYSRANIFSKLFFCWVCRALKVKCYSYFG